MSLNIIIAGDEWKNAGYAICYSNRVSKWVVTEEGKFRGETGEDKFFDIETFKMLH